MTTVPQKTRLFTLRMWQEAVGDDQAAFEWRDKVQALPGGEACTFRDWPGLDRAPGGDVESRTRRRAKSWTP